MKKHYTVSHNGQEISFNHHEEVAEQIQNYCKEFLLYEWAEKGKEVFKVGETEIFVTDLIESWTGYPLNRTAKVLYEQLANSVYNDYFADSINDLIGGNNGVIGITFSKYDFSIIMEEGEI